MSKRFYLLLVATLAFMSVNARQINEREAQLKAEKFFGKQGQNHSNMRRAPRKAPKLMLASNREELYIFNDEANGGYVVISGDDRMPDVLAYSYDGLYDGNEIPDNMRAWMDDYAAQVAYLKSHPEAKVKKKTATERENISPLLTCWFNQDSPYNNKCPKVGNDCCPTGCIATAMAEIMYYYQWPKQTTEVIPGYTTGTLRISIPEQPITTIDWGNIRGEYRDNYSNEETDAVSTLMVLCGTAVNMDYCIDGSEASDYNAAKALRKIFDYDDLVGVVARGRNTDSWERMIYEELSCSRPVLYCGSKINVGGHAFVMDGYEDGYFHVNWGWGGTYSYVLMTDVGGFNVGQTAIVGIQPVNPDPAAPRQYAVLDNGKMTLYYDNEKNLRSGTVIPHKDEWCNYRNDITECVIDPSFSNLRLRSLFCFFDGLSQLKSIDGIENLRMDNVMDMAGMFQSCSSLTSLDLSGFNTENVINMYCMFGDCSSLKSLDLSGFNTENVTNMGGMFNGCSGLTNLDLSSLNTENVTDMSCMFNICSSLKSLDLRGLNTANVTDMSGMFQSCSSLTSLDLSGFNTDNVTSMVYMFNGCSSLTSLDLSNFKTDNVTDMYRMFENCSSLTSLDLSGLNTANVTNMRSMFEKCSGLRSLDVSGLNTANVTDMEYMFCDCSSLTSLDLSGLNTANVTNMGSMFQSCSSLTSLNISGLNTANVTDMGGMFWFCSSLTSLDLSSFKTDKVSSMASMFSGCSSLTSLDLSSFKTDNVTCMNWMFQSCFSLTNLDLSGFKTDNVTMMAGMFYGCSSITNLDLSSFNTANVTDMDKMFYVCRQLKKIYVGAGWTTKNVTSGDYMFDECYKLDGGAGTRYDSNHRDCSYANIDRGKVNPGYFRDKNLLYLDPYALLSENNTILTFYYDGRMEVRGGMDVYERQWESHSGDIITVVFDESFTGCTTLTSTSSWFKNCSKLLNILDIENLRTDNVTDMSSMFYGCSSLTSLDINSLNTNVVAHMDRMFFGCGQLTKIYVGTEWTTNNVKSGDYMFYGCSNLMGGAGTSYDWNHIDYTYAHIDGGMANPGYFRDGNTPDSDPYAILSNDNSVLTFFCDNLKESRQGMDVNERQWELHSVDITTVVFDESCADCTTLTSTAYWFSGCSKLKNIEGIDNLRTDNVTNMYRMFEGCSSLTSLDLSGLNTVNVTNMARMFQGCSSLTSLDLSSFNTDNVTNLSSMFSSCSSLTSLDLSGFKTDNVTSMDWMFYGCSGLTSLDVSGFKTVNVTNMKYMFYYCQNLKTIYVREGWNTSKVRNSNDMFSGCQKLVGGSGTTYNSNHTTADYAHIDGGVTNPGYLTYKDTHKTIIYMVDGEEYKLYRIEIGEEITPEPKPTKDGYVFIGWDDIPATMPDYDVVVTGAFYPYGDVNTDNDIDVLDVVDIARYVVEIPSESFVKQLADVNKDGDVNLGDAVTLVNEIAGEQNFVRAKASPKDNYINDVLSLTEWKGILSLNLQNERYYTAFQFDLYVPEGSDVTQMSLNTKRKQGHQLLYNKVKDGHYRVAALSTSNNEFNGNEGELLNIIMNGLYNDEVSIRDIHFFDVKGNDYLFDDIEGSNTTSLNSLTPALSEREGDIYNVAGQRLNKMQKGINIVGGKKVVIK